jgi:flagellar basal body-associated protein FliL
MADEEETHGEDGEKPKKKGGSPLMLVLLLVNTLGVLGVGAYVVLVMPKGAPAAMSPEEMAAQGGSGGKENAGSGGHGAGKEPKEKGEGAPESGAAGPMLDVGEVIVNLREPGGDHFLKTKLSLELDVEETRPEVEARLSQIRYQINMLLAGQRMTDVQGPEKMEALRQAMVRRVNAVLTSGRVVGVWPEVWIVQ